MKYLILLLLLSSASGYTVFNLDDWDLSEIEFFDVQDDYPVDALSIGRSIDDADEHDAELVAALDEIRSFTVQEEMQLRVAVRDLCLRIMYIK